MKKIHIFLLANITINSIAAALALLILVLLRRQDTQCHNADPETAKLAAQTAQVQEVLHNQSAMIDYAMERLETMQAILVRMEKAYKKGLGLWRFEYPGERRDDEERNRGRE